MARRSARLRATASVNSMYRTPSSNVVRVTASPAYLRFHGRNREKWWIHAEAWERYDYLYTEAELSEWLPRIRSLAAGAETCFVFFNNHARGQAVANAAMLASLLALSP